ncbi:hypothetical protein PAPYR_2057 [Paratrimastix pyriformis]|uniref:B box-type domain-containing protein n=1 Tax=Paratrimastix pyriformis TaxID=342808 RepID=A0ABQ8USR2_9EUKA|nr:hypothetical protein PAPYR_2057 [Paratrimastix pyriformis]
MAHVSAVSNIPKEEPCGTATLGGRQPTPPFSRQTQLINPQFCALHPGHLVEGRCAVCDVLVCEQCFDPDQGQHSSHAILDRTPVCHRHRGHVHGVCVECNCRVCGHCVLEDHRGHHIVPMQTFCVAHPAQLLHAHCYTCSCSICPQCRPYHPSHVIVPFKLQPLASSVLGPAAQQQQQLSPPRPVPPLDMQALDTGDSLASHSEGSPQRSVRASHATDGSPGRPTATRTGESSPRRQPSAHGSGQSGGGDDGGSQEGKGIRPRCRHRHARNADGGAAPRRSRDGAGEEDEEDEEEELDEAALAEQQRRQQALTENATALWAGWEVAPPEKDRLGKGLASPLMGRIRIGQNYYSPRDADNSYERARRYQHSVNVAAKATRAWLGAARLTQQQAALRSPRQYIPPADPEPLRLADLRLVAPAPPALEEIRETAASRGPEAADGAERSPQRPDGHAGQQ